MLTAADLEKFSVFRFIWIGLVSVFIFFVQEISPVFSIYVLKRTELYSQSVWQSGIVYDVLLAAGLFLFLLLRPALKNIIQRKTLFYFALLNILLSVPAFTADFTKPLQFENIIKFSLITGVLKPLACFGLFAVFTRFSNFREFPEIKFSHILAASICIFGISRIIWGSPVPKLEDELAYYIQALIYSKGQIVQKIIPPEGISGERIKEILQIPYIIFDGDLYYSAHYHGWSLVLALFNSIHLISFAGITVSVLASAVFFLILKELYPEDRDLSFIGMTVLFSSPSFLFLSSTYMSHSFTLLLCSLIFYFWLKGRQNSFYFLFLFLLVPAVFITRIQSSAAFFCALLISDLTEAVVYKKTIKDILYLRIMILIFAVLIGAAAVYLYYTQFPAGKVLLTDHYFSQFLTKNCQSLGIGENHGCFPTYGTLGHSFRKMLLINWEELYSLNNVFSPSGVPLLSIILYSFWKLKNSFHIGKTEFTLLLIVLSQIGIYGLYWHNGGESYQGRYLLDCGFAFMILGASALRPALKDFGRTPIISFIIFSLTINLFFKIKGEFFTPYIQPVSSIQKISPGREKIENCLVYGKSNPSNGIDSVSEFTGNKISFSLKQTKSFINTGAVNFFALTDWIDDEGYFRDRKGNSFVWDSETEENRLIEEKLHLTDSCKVVLKESSSEKMNRWVKKIHIFNPSLEMIKK